MPTRSLDGDLFIRRLPIVILAVATLSLAACEGAGNKQKIGALLGAAAGGIAGAQVGKGRGQLAATAVGTLLGALAGSEIGKSLDRADMLYLERTQQQALETAPAGTRSSWSNPDSGNSGDITPRRTYQDAAGTYCREFQQTVTVGSASETAYGTACRQSDGAWRIVSG